MNRNKKQISLEFVLAQGVICFGLVLNYETVLIVWFDFISYRTELHPSAPGDETRLSSYSHNLCLEIIMGTFIS